MQTGTVRLDMRRILIGIVALSIAGCSQEPAAEVEKAPTEDLASKPLPSYSVSRTSGDLQLELKSFKEHDLVEARITNVGAEPIVAFVPDHNWSLELVPKDGPWTYPPPPNYHIIDHYDIQAHYWRTLEPGGDVRGFPDLEFMVQGVLNDDGWYECTLEYDDSAANGMSRTNEFDVVSEIGEVSFPPIEVHVVDGTAVEWRPLEDS